MNLATEKLVLLLEHTVHTIAFRVDCPTPEKTQLLDALHDFKVEVGAIKEEATPDDCSDFSPAFNPVLASDRP